MLAFQPMKRARENDSDSDDERHIKKTRPWNIRAHSNGRAHFPSPSSLPLRHSFTPSPPCSTPDFEEITPAPSEASEANSPAPPQEDRIIFSSPHDGMDMDLDLTMDDDDFDIIGSQPPDSPLVPFALRPAKLNPQIIADSASNNTGRIPTPIYPNFHTPRGPMSIAGMAGFNYPNSGMAGGFTSDNTYLGVPPVPIQQPPASRKNSRDHDQDRSRRMPSPISEDEDIPDTPTALTQSQLSRLTVTSHNPPSEHMDVEGNTAHGGKDGPPPGVVTTPSRGRKRSGAFTGKGRFSMGYREDCEKCKAKVPGHYSHFLP
ncbi:uncharacterized protein BDR25DRAFT_282220 [Lindgomyces ingoldianus]|uniref:Uncharacterized protein n=1 Tax=Lindgomyces ingoldianus TaxID=673940 RepID=A0ACB6R1L7_9PLEO|nr:uncharacterized protein BDR25DRAFT_282220 [Lindgomyces ingoldianus]KAF2473036.1 hypothetical protein BDR25DRAFT_282220 [Lindgomyces ingoldianus]